MTNLTIPDEIKKELSVDQEGKAFASLRAVARLCGLSHHYAISNLLKNIVDKKRLAKTLLPFAGQDFQGGEKIPDILVAAIITHYAWKGREEAQAASLAFQAIGIRIWIQKELGWSAIVHQPNNRELEEIKLEREGLAQAVEKSKEEMLFMVDCFLKERFQEANERFTEKFKELDILSREQNKYLVEHRKEITRLKEEIQTLKEHKEISEVLPKDFNSSVRRKINQMVSDYVASHPGVVGGNVYISLYKEFAFQTGYDAYIRSKILGCTCIEAVEADRQLGNFFSFVAAFLA